MRWLKKRPPLPIPALESPDNMFKATRFVPIQTFAQLERYFDAAGPATVFLHDPWCPISLDAFDEMSGLGVEVATVDVSRDRQLSRWVEDRTGVRHQSPQAFVVADREIRWHGSHGAIKRNRVMAELVLVQSETD